MTTATPSVTHSDRPRRARPVTRRLLAHELRLVARDPFTLAFTLAFPIVAMLVVGGAFGSEPAPRVPAQPLALVHRLLLHRDDRRHRACAAAGAHRLLPGARSAAPVRRRGVSALSFALAELTLGLIAIGIAGIALLVVAAPVYGVPVVEDPLRVAAGMIAGSVALVSIGVLLGTLLPSARAAQAVGLLLYFPSLLLGVGGPPTFVMPPGLRAIAEHLPLALVNQAIRDPWLGLGDGTAPLLIVTAIAILATVLAVRRSRL